MSSIITRLTVADVRLFPCRWFTIGSILFAVTSVFILFNSFTSTLGEDDSDLDGYHYRATWLFMVISGVFFTLSTLISFFDCIVTLCVLLSCRNWHCVHPYSFIKNISPLVTYNLLLFNRFHGFYARRTRRSSHQTTLYMVQFLISFLFYWRHAFPISSINGNDLLNAL